MKYLTDDLSIPVKFKRDCTNKKCYFSFYDWFTDEFIGRIDLSELSNTSDDPFVRESEVSGGGSDITVVQNYSALPAASDHNEEFYWVEESQGTKWLPAGLGGTYYNRGLYYSDGSTWTNVEVPWNATLTEVNTGTNNDKFVTPLTLATSDLATKFTWTFDFRGGTLTENVVADEDFQIDSVTDLNASPTTTIEVNSAAYTLGDPISEGDEIDITVDVSSVIRLNITRI